MVRKLVLQFQTTDFAGIYQMCFLSKISLVLRGPNEQSISVIFYVIWLLLLINEFDYDAKRRRRMGKSWTKTDWNSFCGRYLKWSGMKKSCETHKTQNNVLLMQIYSRHAALVHISMCDICYKFQFAKMTHSMLSSTHLVANFFLMCHNVKTVYNKYVFNLRYAYH